MPKLSQLKRETATVTIETGGEPLVVEYRKAFVTPRLAEQLEIGDTLQPSAQLGVLADMVRAAVVSWNLTDEDDQPIPLTAEAVATIDAGALKAVVQAIQEAMQSDPLSDSGSSSGSTARADPEPLLIGMAS